MSMPIVTPCDRVEEIRTRLRQTPLGAVREILPDRAILEACQACGHTFRRRQYDPVVTVLHPGMETLLEGIRVKGGEDSPKSVMRGNPVGQFQKGAEPRLLGLAELGDGDPVVGPADDGSEGQRQNIPQLVQAGALHPRVRQDRKMFPETRGHPRSPSCEPLGRRVGQAGLHSPH